MAERLVAAGRFAKVNGVYVTLALKGAGEMSRKWQVAWGILLLGCIIGCLIIVLWGFRADNKQQDTLRAVPGLVRSVEDWKDRSGQPCRIWPSSHCTVDIMQGVRLDLNNISTTLTSIEGLPSPASDFYNEYWN